MLFSNLLPPNYKTLFAEGINILDLFWTLFCQYIEFNLEDPYVYNNQGKYPMFIVNGCNAGNFFLYDTTRFSSSNQTLSEKYVLASKGVVLVLLPVHIMV